MMTVAVVAWQSTRRFERTVSSFPVRELFLTAIPLWGNAVLGMVEKSFGQLALGVLATAEDVAVYSVALRTAMLVSFVLLAVNSISFPTFAALFRENRLEELKSNAIWSAKLTTVTCLPIVLAIIAFPDLILRMFGADYAAGSGALRLMAVGQFVNAATGSVWGLLAMTGNERSVFTGAVMSAIVMIVLSIVLVPMFGVNGAAAAQAASISCRMVFYVLCAKKTLGFTPLGFSV